MSLRDLGAGRAFSGQTLQNYQEQKLSPYKSYDKTPGTRSAFTPPRAPCSQENRSSHSPCNLSRTAAFRLLVRTHLWWKVLRLFTTHSNSPPLLHTVQVTLPDLNKPWILQPTHLRRKAKNIQRGKASSPINGAGKTGSLHKHKKWDLTCTIYENQLEMDSRVKHFLTCLGDDVLYLTPTAQISWD